MIEPGTRRRLMWHLVLGLTVIGAPAQGAPFQAAEILPDLEFDRRASADVFHLSDFAGKVVVLDWFAHWCPFCQQAAEPVRSMMQQYQAAGGNTHGVPVVHVSLNLVANEDAQTDAFIAAHGLQLVADDTERALASRFRTGGQPIFAIINCVADSPTHKRNELLVSYLGFDAGSTIQTLQAYINTVKPPGTPAAPRIYLDLRSDEPISYGGSLVLSVDALGSPALQYQWFKDNQPLPAGTGSSWNITNADDSDAGSYRVHVSNGVGSADSKVAKVTVQAPPAFTGIQFDNNHLAILGMRTKAGRIYQLRGSANLVDWDVIGEFMATGPSTAVRDPGSGTIPTRYYQLRER